MKREKIFPKLTHAFMHLMLIGRAALTPNSNNTGNHRDSSIIRKLPCNFCSMIHTQLIPNNSCKKYISQLGRCKKLHIKPSRSRYRYHSRIFLGSSSPRDRGCLPSPPRCPRSSTSPRSPSHRPTANMGKKGSY